MLYDVTVDGHYLKAMLDTVSSLSLLKPCFVSTMQPPHLFSVCMGI